MSLTMCAFALGMASGFYKYYNYYYFYVYVYVKGITVKYIVNKVTPDKSYHTHQAIFYPRSALVWVGTDAS